MRFLFIGPGFCLKLPSDSTSRWTPLLSANGSHCQAHSGLSPPSYCPCRAHPKTGQGINPLPWLCSLVSPSEKSGMRTPSPSPTSSSPTHARTGASRLEGGRLAARLLHPCIRTAAAWLTSSELAKNNGISSADSGPDFNGRNRTVSGACTAFHADLLVCNPGFSVFHD